MKNQINQSDARNLVDRIIASNDASMAGQLTINLDGTDKTKVLGSINNLNFGPLSTPFGAPT